MKKILAFIILILVISSLIFWIGTNMQNVDCGPQCPIEYEWNVFPIIVVFVSLFAAGGLGITYLLSKLK